MRCGMSILVRLEEGVSNDACDDWPREAGPGFATHRPVDTNNNARSAPTLVLPSDTNLLALARFTQLGWRVPAIARTPPPTVWRARRAPG
jgi:hypothetical protein